MWELNSLASSQLRQYFGSYIYVHKVAISPDTKSADVIICFMMRTITGFCLSQIEFL